MQDPACWQISPMPPASHAPSATPCVELRPRGTGHDPGRIAVDLAVMLADGGEAIADLALLATRAARQWCGALGKKSLCQVGVSLHAVTDAASVPVTWRLFLPAEWADPCDGRRSKAGVPEDVGHREKWRLALDAIDEARGWGLDGRIVVADAGYGQMHAFRTGLTERGLDYVTAVRADTSAHPGDAVPTVPAREGRMGARDCPATGRRSAR